MRSVVALFGESEKGQFKVPYLVREMPQLIDILGSPPEESVGLSFAIQTLLFQREVLFFRVEAEGFSYRDYLHGFSYLEKVKDLHAVALPGVGDPLILNACLPLCEKHKSCLITNPQDLYDYLTIR